MQKQKVQKQLHPNDEHSQLARAARTSDFTGIKFTPAVVRFPINNGNTFAHICALHGHLLAIPEDLRTAELMALRNEAGQTVEDLFKLQNEKLQQARRGRERAKIESQALREQVRRVRRAGRRRAFTLKPGHEPWDPAKADALVRKIFGLPEGSTEDPFETKD